MTECLLRGANWVLK